MKWFVKNAGSVVAIAVIVCLLLVGCINYVGMSEPPTLYDKHPFEWASRTGPLGDTIGGIITPILTLAGLIYVYFTLKEQIDSARIEQDQAKNQNLFTTSLSLVDRLVSSLPLLMKVSNSIEDPSGTATVIEYWQESIRELTRAITFVLNQFDFIQKLNHKAELTDDQILVLTSILGSNYLPRLDQAYSKLGYLVNTVGYDYNGLASEAVERAEEQIKQMKAQFKHYLKN